ncbi:M48 family metallopeptidase [Algivirga pacifica]|uniref:M48 family metallopeptidase n=1 Tax=Algivirga pacifica TaxID=1162670 RepID=A0ABP9D2Z6_9BACT
MKYIIYALLFLGIAACTSVPITGRKQLTFIPNDQILSLSKQSYRDVLKDSKLSTNELQVQRLRKIGNRISSAVEQYLKSVGREDLIKGYVWEFNLIESDQLNAWAMPGGKVAFYTGILPVCKNDDGIAVVMSHEIAHAIAQHGNERMSQQQIQQGSALVLDAAMMNKSPETRALAMTAFGLGSQVGIMLPYSRKHESEADELGLYFMALAGYNLQEAPKFWERMAATGGGAPPELLSTHPSHSTRIKNMEKNIPKAEAFAKKQ